jgi:hypothetical protein
MTAARKPPEPGSHAEIEGWMRSQMPDLQPILVYLDRLIRKSIPNLQYGLKWKRPYYGLAERGWIIEIAPYDVSVNLVFLGGANFDDPPPEGTGSSRYIKIRSLDEARSSEIGEWIEQAAECDGWR